MNIYIYIICLCVRASLLSFQNEETVKQDCASELLLFILYHDILQVYGTFSKERLKTTLLLSSFNPSVLSF